MNDIALPLPALTSVLDHLATLSSTGDKAATSTLAKCMRLATWTHNLASRRLYTSIPIAYNTLPSLLYNHHTQRKAHSLSLVTTLHIHSPPSWDVHPPAKLLFPNASTMTFTPNAVSDLSFAPHTEFKAFLAAQRPGEVYISLLPPEADWHRPQRDWLGWLAELLVFWDAEVTINGYDYTRVIEPVRLGLPGCVKVHSMKATVGPSYWHAVAQCVGRAERSSPRPEVLYLDAMPPLTCACGEEYEEARGLWEGYIGRVAAVACAARETELLERLQVEAERNGVDWVKVLAERVGCAPEEYDVEKGRAVAHKEGISLRHLQIGAIGGVLGVYERLEGIRVVLGSGEGVGHVAVAVAGEGKPCTDAHIWRFQEPGGTTSTYYGL